MPQSTLFPVADRASRVTRLIEQGALVVKPAVREVDMSTSNEWGQFAADWRHISER